jgi:hypothetical protein
MRQPVVFHRLRQKSFCQFRRRMFAEGPKSKLLLTLDGVALSVPLSSKVLVNRLWEYADLLCNELEQGRRRPFADAESPTGIAQIATHDGVTQTVVVAAAARDGCQVSLRQCVVADQLALLSRRTK